MNTMISFEEFSAIVGRRLRLLRHKNDEKLATAAKGLDISMAQLSDIENGSTNKINNYLLINTNKY